MSSYHPWEERRNRAGSCGQGKKQVLMQFLFKKSEHSNSIHFLPLAHQIGICSPYPSRLLFSVRGPQNLPRVHCSSKWMKNVRISFGWMVMLGPLWGGKGWWELPGGAEVIYHSPLEPPASPGHHVPATPSEHSFCLHSCGSLCGNGLKLLPF